MNAILAAEVERHVNLGWRVISQTETTVALEDRTPFGWIWFALSMFFFFGLGGALYLLFWLLTSTQHVFLRVEDDKVVPSGDTWLVDNQVRDREAGRKLAMDIKQRGYLPAMWPSILATMSMMAVWVFLFWLLVNKLD